MHLVAVQSDSGKNSRIKGGRRENVTKEKQPIRENVKGARDARKGGKARAAAGKRLPTPPGRTEEK